jgi:rhodanese-related sulfurtransferase
MLLSLLLLLQSPLATTASDVRSITVQELRAAVLAGDAVPLDVRGSVPHAYGHIEGALWIPLGHIDQRAGELPRDKMIVPYCTCSADQLSIEAVQRLRKLGFTRLAVLEGGYPAWSEAGLPVEKSVQPAEPPPPPVPSEQLARGGRLMPPSQIPCAADDVTVYYGRVTSYNRSKGRTTLRIRTDYDTTETVTIRHPGTSDPSKWFLLFGEPFRASSWRGIEVKRGVLKKGMRVHAWVCTDGKAILDWRPGESASPSR